MPEIPRMQHEEKINLISGFEHGNNRTEQMAHRGAHSSVQRAVPSLPPISRSDAIDPLSLVAR